MQRLLYILLLLVLGACIDQVDLTTGGNEPKLVVDAWISNDPEMSYVQVYYSAPFRSGETHLQNFDAEVDVIWVEKQQGSSIGYVNRGDFDRRSITTYRPNEDFDFQAGDQFRLNVQLKDGSHIQSDWQKVAEPAGEIEFDYEISKGTIFIETTYGRPFQQIRHFIDLKARIEKAAEGNHQYYIKTSGIEQLFAQSTNDNCSCTCYLPIPNLKGTLNAVNETDFSGSSMLVELGKVNLSRVTLFYVDMDIYAVGPNAGILSNISDQQNNTGSIFDPAPFKIRGNLKNLQDENMEVLGNFFTANHTSKDWMIRRGEFFSRYRDMHFKRAHMPFVWSTCTDYYTDASTTVPPPFLNP